MSERAVFEGRRVAAAVRTEEDFTGALESKVEVIFMQYSSILTVEDLIRRCHEAGKKIFIHKKIIIVIFIAF